MAVWLGLMVGAWERPRSKEKKEGRREGKEVGKKGVMEGQGKKEGREEGHTDGSCASGSTKIGMNDPNLELQKPHQKVARVSDSVPLSHSLQDTIRGMAHVFLKFGYSL